MFKLLLITAHPSPVSFNFALRHAAVARIAAGGGETLTSDLFQMGFGSLAGEGDFNNYDSALPMDLMEAQKNAPRHGGFVPQILAEQEKLVAADAVMLQFPIWWGSYPAPLKGWIDRVLSYGFAYGRSKTLPDKKVLYSVTTGGVSGPEEV
ncbi:MAG TPA: NAD(P)H-dependent oxidoreductase, partial [Calditrichia bacterium]|nr:NAD(P)H-dependent oxidoreductase [Calditrichia bacterium]